MNIAILYQNIDSGAKVATEALLQELRTRHPEHNYLVYQQDIYRYSGYFSFIRNLVWSIFDFRHFINQQKNIQVIYTSVYISIIAQLISQKRGVPSIFHLHGDHKFGQLPQSSGVVFFVKSWYTALLGRVILFLQAQAIKKSSRILFVSRFAKEEFVKTYPLQRYLSKFSVIYNGVDTNKYFPITDKTKISLRNSYKLPSSKKVITYIGRIDEKKGIHHLLSAAAFLKKETLILIIFPQTKDKHAQRYLDTLKKTAQKLSAQVRFIENPTALSPYYQCSDCVVLPSQQEMLPLVLLEALATGVPCVCPPIGGIPEVLSQLPILLLHTVTPHDLADKISALFSMSETEQKKLKIQEIKLAKKYQWAQSANMLEEIFCEVTQQQ